MKSMYQIFFAIPFDSDLKNLYEVIRYKIKDDFNNITTIIGNVALSPSPNYSDIINFKSQNKELNDQFIKVIEKSDIVIADLTGNNANVHFELGIALMCNKNILRVTNSPHIELAFDTRNLETFRYIDVDILYNKIKDYLEKFFLIKNLQINNLYPELYFKDQTPRYLRTIFEENGKKIHTNTHSFYSIENKNLKKIRDAGIKIEFIIEESLNSDDWFGIYIRALHNPIMGSYLLYIRKMVLLKLLHISASLR